MGKKHELTLQKHWDLIWSDDLPRDENHNLVFPIFVGRLEETNRLSGLISKRRHGAFFIGGNYGSGKTSTAYKSVYSQNGSDPIVVPITHLLLNAKSEDEDLVYETIRQMIRSLKRKKSLKNIESLEKLSHDLTLTKYLRSGSLDKLKTIKKSIDLDQNSFERVLRGIKNYVPQIIGLLAGITSFTSNVSFQWILQYINNDFSKLLVSAVTSLIFFFLSKFSIQAVQLTEKKSSELYEIDGISIHELQERFHDVLEIIEKEKKCEVVFIFEELDQFDNGNNKDSIGPNRLLRVLKSLKLLFHNSPATFLFLLGPDTFKLLESDSFRTLPTEKLFISKASPTELFTFLSEIVDKSKSQEINDNTWKYFQALKIKEARGNFYNLVRIIRENRRFITSDDKLNQEAIELPNLSKDDEFQAALLMALFPFIDRFNEEERENVFEGLLTVIEHYEFNLSQQILSHMENLPNDIQVRKIMVSYLEQIFKVGQGYNPQITIPHFDSVPERTRIMEIQWDELRKSLPNENYSLLYINQKGAILEEEHLFIKQYNDLILSLREIAKKAKIRISSDLKIDDLFNILSNHLGYPYSDTIVELSNQVDEVFNSIVNVALRERGENWYQNLVMKHIPALERINASLQENIIDEYIVRIGVVQKIDSPQVRGFSLGERPHAGGSEFASLIRRIKAPKGINRTFELNIPEQGIINLLLGTSPWSNDFQQQEFYMVRFDNRSNSSHGILYKGKNESNWKSHVMMPAHSEPEKNIQQIKLSYSRGLLKASISGNEALEENIGKVYWFAIANELTKTDVKFKKF